TASFHADGLQRAAPSARRVAPWAPRTGRASTHRRSLDMRRNCSPPPADRGPPAETIPRSRRCRPAAPGGRSPAKLLSSFHDRPSTVRRTAMADVETEVVLGVIVLFLVLVIVRDLFARRDLPQCVDPDLSALDHRLGIGIARVVDESCLVPVPRRVDARAAVQNEEKSMMSRHRLIVVAAVRLGVAHLLAGVLDHPRALRDVAAREYAEAMNRRSARLEPFVNRTGLTGRRAAVCRRTRGGLFLGADGRAAVRACGHGRMMRQ